MGIFFNGLSVTQRTHEICLVYVKLRSQRTYLPVSRHPERRKQAKREGGAGSEGRERERWRGGVRDGGREEGREGGRQEGKYDGQKRQIARDTEEYLCYCRAAFRSQHTISRSGSSCTKMKCILRSITLENWGGKHISH